MLEAGLPTGDVLTSAMLYGWEACRGDKCGRRLGSPEDGAATDIVVLDSDPRADIGALRKVSFVMKDAKVWKGDGIAVGMV